MAVPAKSEASSIDFRVYIGIVFFRWKIIVVFFLYALLAGVLYIHFAPKKYMAACRIAVFRDATFEVTQMGQQWSSVQRHVRMLRDRDLRGIVVNRLADSWGRRLGSSRHLWPDVDVRPAPGGNLVAVSVSGPNRDYALAFLQTMIQEHRKRWQSVQRASTENATRMLEEELRRLEEKIKAAEDNMIEYQRLHDLARVEARSSIENQYLVRLMARRSQIQTELMLLEAQFPRITDENYSVIGKIDKMTRETGRLPARAQAAADPLDEYLGLGADEPDTAGELPAGDLFAGFEDSAGEDLSDDERGWHRIRVQLVQAEAEYDQLSQNLSADHPRMVALMGRRRSLQGQLDLAAEIQLREMRDQYRALQIQSDAIEAAEYKWQAKYLLASQRQAELKRIAAVVNRYEHNYNTLYSRLHNMRIQEELNAERFHLDEPVHASPRPVWPDPLKILLVAVTLGLGSGLGMALTLQVLDNKIQSIKDVEAELGIPFLGGIPYWVHSGLENSIRPIVTEEHSTGAVEAYRALRTSLLSALQKVNEKIVVVTSADSREGKTLTVLNLAIMIAQMGKRVLLVDMDLRRGRLHRSLGCEREPGLADALKKGLSLREVTARTRIENLDVVPTGTTIENTAEMLQSASMESLFVDVQDDYDYILCDSSPVLRVTDTVIVATQGLGVVVYVARVNHTPKPLIRYSLDMLKDGHVLGLIMNSIEMHKISSLYYSYQYPNYAYYSNAYAYGYNYYHYGDHGQPGRRARIWGGQTRQALRSAAEWFRRTFLPLD